MHILLRSIVCISTLSILNTYSLLGYAEASQNAHGNCIYQNGEDNINSSVTIICNIGSFLAGGFPNFPESKIETILHTEVNNLRPGSKSFILTIRNDSPNQTIYIPTRSLTLLDDLGNTYQLDRWGMFDLGFEKTIPAKKKIKIPYVLSSPIARSASQITFNLDGVWSQPKGNRFKKPLPELEWNINLNRVRLF